MCDQHFTFVSNFAGSSSLRVFSFFGDFTARGVEESSEGMLRCKSRAAQALRQVVRVLLGVLSTVDDDASAATRGV